MVLHGFYRQRHNGQVGAKQEKGPVITADFKPAAINHFARAENESGGADGQQRGPMHQHVPFDFQSKRHKENRNQETVADRRNVAGQGQPVMFGAAHGQAQEKSGLCRVQTEPVADSAHAQDQ